MNFTKSATIRLLSNTLPYASIVSITDRFGKKKNSTLKAQARTRRKPIIPPRNWPTTTSKYRLYPKPDLFLAAHKRKLHPSRPTTCNPARCSPFLKDTWRAPKTKPHTAPTLTSPPQTNRPTILPIYPPRQKASIALPRQRTALQRRQKVKRPNNGPHLSRLLAGLPMEPAAAAIASPAPTVAATPVEAPEGVAPAGTGSLAGGGGGHGAAASGSCSSAGSEGPRQQPVGRDAPNIPNVVEYHLKVKPQQDLQQTPATATVSPYTIYLYPCTCPARDAMDRFLGRTWFASRVSLFAAPSAGFSFFSALPPLCAAPGSLQMRRGSSPLRNSPVGSGWLL